MRSTALTAAAVVVAVLSIVSTAGAAKRDPACSASPGNVSSGEGYTLSAHGLPGGNVNLIVSVPDGTKMTSAIGTSGGSYSRYYEAPAWSGETGTYTYAFVGKVTWPAGTYNQIYATCSVQVG
jgi:hypothetical protein